MLHFIHKDEMEGGEKMHITITKKRLVTTAAAVIITMTPLVAVAPAYAASNTNSSNNFLSGLIHFIAQKFGLDESKVQSAISEYTQQHKVQVQQHIQNREKTRLDKLVQQGKITSSQEQAILDELDKVRGEMSSVNLKAMTRQERRQQFQKEQDELKAWAQSQGINMSFIVPPMGRMRMRGFFRHEMNGPWSGSQQTPTPTT